MNVLLFILIRVKKRKVVVRIPHHRFVWLADKMTWTVMKLSAGCIGPIVVWTFNVTSQRDTASASMRRSTVQLLK
jgi:hypothetical protein